jgi:dihydropyrimidine dehydrogenase (NAD+) subunit PreT
MSHSPAPATPLGLCTRRLPLADYAQRLGDAHPPLSAAQAVAEAERCLYCFDAPCTIACPTGIDVPTFVTRIAQGNLRGAAKTILEENILGGMCARVCPTEVLCEQACVRNTESGQPVQIGLLQRHATDAVQHTSAKALFERAPSTGKRVAVVGAGPAGLSAAHRLAWLGHAVTLFDAKPKLGGLNEYGLATYKTPDNFAQREIEWLLSIGGIETRLNSTLGEHISLEGLCKTYDAVFLGLGLGDVQTLGLANEQTRGVRYAVDFISELRQAEHPSQVPVGSCVVVIGGGMTAVDAAVQSKLLGALSVTMVVRRGPEHMAASVEEQRWARENGVLIQHYAAPQELLVQEGQLQGLRLANTELRNGGLHTLETGYVLPADMLLIATGQKMETTPVNGLSLTAGKVATAPDGKTNHPKIWVGGDSRHGGKDLTVEAVQHGKLAALSIHRHLIAA